MAQYEKYAITAQRLTGIADQARSLSEFPYSHVCEDTLQAVTTSQPGESFSGAASGFLPEVARGAATSEFTLPFAASAMG